MINLDLQISIKEQMEVESEATEEVETGKSQSKRSIFLTQGLNGQFQPLSARIAQVKSLQKFRSERAQKKFDQFKKLKVKDSLPNFRARKLASFYLFNHKL